MRKILFLLLATAAAAVWTSCSSAPPAIPDDISAAELIQQAQEASDKSDWATAVLYYETARERFGTDSGVLVTCEYEIAFIHYKQGKYAEAEEEFLALIAKYDTPAGANLPPSYLILARKVLPVIQEKQTKAESTTQS